MEAKIAEPSEASEKRQALYAEIKETFGIPFVPGLFEAMGDDPDYLETAWQQVKVVMGPGELTRREKELVAVAVSATNNCSYCITAHTAALRGLGLTDGGVLELMEVVALFNGFNALAHGLRLEPDAGFRRV